MKRKLNSALILGAIFEVMLLMLIASGGLGLILHFGFITFELDRLMAWWIFMGMLCAILAYKKNKEPGTALFAGVLFGPLAIIYYLVCKKGMSDKEKEIHEWELEKKYKTMQAERAENQKNKNQD